MLSWYSKAFYSSNVKLDHGPHKLAAKLFF